jgi:hypothetical protein
MHEIFGKIHAILNHRFAHLQPNKVCIIIILEDY